MTMNECIKQLECLRAHCDAMAEAAAARCKRRGEEDEVR